MRALLETGQTIATQRIREAQNSLTRIETYLEEINIQEALRSKASYKRTLPEWKAITNPWMCEQFNVHSYMNTMSKLYAAAEESGVCPLYFQGLLVNSNVPKNHNEQCPATIKAYIRTAQVPTMPYSLPLQSETIPAHTYEGQRFENHTLHACFKACFHHIKQNPGKYLLTEIWDTELPENTYVVELLKVKL